MSIYILGPVVQYILQSGNQLMLLELDLTPHLPVTFTTQVLLER